MQRGRSASDRGSVTAEFAAVLPAVVLVVALCLAGVQAVGQQVRLTDAAADAARLLARGDSAAIAVDRLAETVGRVSLDTDVRGDFVCVELRAPSAFGPAGALGVTISASGCALGGMP